MLKHFRNGLIACAAITCSYSATAQTVTWQAVDGLYELYDDPSFCALKMPEMDDGSVALVYAKSRASLPSITIVDADSIMRDFIGDGYGMVFWVYSDEGYINERVEVRRVEGDNYTAPISVEAVNSLKSASGLKLHSISGAVLIDLTLNPSHMNAGMRRFMACQQGL